VNTKYRKNRATKNRNETIKPEIKAKRGEKKKSANEG
jgi:hypothetical protein